MVAVARLAANAAGVPLVMITSTLRLTSSDASSVKRAAQPFVPVGGFRVGQRADDADMSLLHAFNLLDVGGIPSTDPSASQQTTTA